MGVFFFFKNRRPRQFEHKPIYFDPHKEEMEKRALKIKNELGRAESDDEFIASIKGTFMEGTSHLKKQKAKGETSASRFSKNILYIVLLAALVLLGWYLFFK